MKRHEIIRSASVRRLLAMLLALTMVLGMSMMFTGCADKGEAEVTTQPDVPEDGGEEKPEEDEPAEEGEKRNGWFVDEEGNVSFYVDNEPHTGFYFNEATGYFVEREFASGWYYFDEQGHMVSGSWIEDSGRAHYITEDGTAAKSGWYTDSKGWYYLEERGLLLADQMFSEGGRQYYLDVDGYLYRIIWEEMVCETQKEKVGLAITERTALVLPEAVSGCNSFAFTYGGEKDPLAWSVWVRTDGVWVDMKDLCDTERAEDGTVMVTFHTPVSFDACCVFSALAEIVVDATLLDVTVCY